MHYRQQHVRIASEISVMRNLHKFHKDSFLGRPYLMFIFNVNEGGLTMFVFVSYLLYSSFQHFFQLITVGICWSYVKRSKYKQTTLYSSYCKHGCDNSLPVLVAKPFL